MNNYVWDERLAAWTNTNGTPPACPDCGTPLQGGRECDCGHTWTVTRLHQSGHAPKTIVRMVPDENILMRVATTSDTATILL